MDGGGVGHNGLGPLVEFEHAIIEGCDVLPPVALRREPSPRRLLLGNLEVSGRSIWIVARRARVQGRLRRLARDEAGDEPRGAAGAYVHAAVQAARSGRGSGPRCSSQSSLSRRREGRLDCRQVHPAHGHPGQHSLSGRHLDTLSPTGASATAWSAWVSPCSCCRSSSCQGCRCLRPEPSERVRATGSAASPTSLVAPATTLTIPGAAAGPPRLLDKRAGHSYAPDAATRRTPRWRVAARHDAVATEAAARG